MAATQELIAPCGIYCAACPLYLAASNEAQREALAARLKTKPENVVCAGCRPAAGSPVPLRGEVCATYKCAADHGHTVCHECAEFPCPKLMPAADRAEVLPHNLKVFLLTALKRDGAEAWAENYARIVRTYYHGKMMIGAGPQLDEPEK